MHTGVSIKTGGLEVPINFSSAIFVLMWHDYHHSASHRSASRPVAAFDRSIGVFEEEVIPEMIQAVSREER